MKGKLLNVRGEQIKKIAENKEISDIKKILGLETGKIYASIEEVHQHLRYGKIMIMYFMYKIFGCFYLMILFFYITYSILLLFQCLLNLNLN